MIIPKRITIISAPRNGSTYLMSVCARFQQLTHNNTLVFPEPFNLNSKHLRFGSVPNNDNSEFKPFQYPTDPDGFVETLKSMITLLTDTECYVNKSHNLQYVYLENQYGGIRPLALLDSYNIRLIRKDIFQSALSRAIGHRTKEWITYTYTDASPFSISISDFRDVWEQAVTFVESLFVNELGFRFDETVFYEDLTGNQLTDWNNLKLNVECPLLSEPSGLSSQFILKAPDKASICLLYTSDAADE